MQGNALYYGDNLDILRRYIADESVDLIYLDPPFNSNQAYNVIFEENNGTGSAAQIEAFDDTWHWTMETIEAYQDVVEAGGPAADALVAFRHMLGETDMMAYLSMMAPRLIELRRVLKDTGSLYLHCDPVASHYLKVLLDAVFSGSNFQNEIIWHYHTGGASKRRFSRKHDTIFMYSASGDYVFNTQREAYREEHTDHFTHTDKEGRRYRIREVGGKRYRYYLDQGRVCHDVWEDIGSLNAVARERLGYPTQKPEALLERIISASSNEGDLVLDPFCGCGTTVVVAERLKRRWIGIDITHLAVNLMKYRLRDTFGPEIKEQYEVVGEPVDVHGAQALAEQDRFQFQVWALGLVGARPADPKKGADEGIDGRIYFHDEPEGGETKQVVISVKSGHTGVAHVRDLRGVVEREDASLGVLITLQEPTRPMITEAAKAGFYRLPWDESKRFPQIQILTIKELLEGKQIQCPPLHRAPATFKRAPKARGPNPGTNKLPIED